MIKEVNGKWKPQRRAVKNKDGVLLQEDQDIRRRWTEYCSDLYNNVEAHERSEEVMKDLEKISPAADETDQPLLKDEVHKAIHKLKKHKSPGSDGIVGEILQAGGDALEEEIFSIMKSVWDEEAIPEEWTKSIIVTIPKRVTCESVATIGQSHL